MMTGDLKLMNEMFVHGLDGGREFLDHTHLGCLGNIFEPCLCLRLKGAVCC